MPDVLNFRGVIRNVWYAPQLIPTLITYPIHTFDVNAADGQGIVDLDSASLGFSRWVSPKRTRSYPYARIYNTYHLPKRVTIIPVIKDEGLGGDCDRINAITFSMMNLLNVFIILVWYDSASLNRRRAGKVTAQKMPTDYVREKLIEISRYQQTALHWNTMHFQRDFQTIYLNAVQAYERIGTTTGILMRPAKEHLAVLELYLRDGAFDLDAFKTATLSRSKSAAQRETRVTHGQEFLEDGAKGYFYIENMLGGQYHLTADEVYPQGDLIVIQESKNAIRGQFPKLADIKDGLLKLILYTNLDELYIEEQRVQFSTTLKLTGRLKGALRLPVSAIEMDQFVLDNLIKAADRNIMLALNREATENRNLRIWITGRT